MAALAEDTLQDYVTDTGETVYPVRTATNIYSGEFVGEDAAGDSRPLVALDKFQGVSQCRANNTSGLAGAINVKVKHECYIVHDVVGVTAKTANDRPKVYASDSATLTLTATSNTEVGTILRWISGASCVVYLKS